MGRAKRCGTTIGSYRLRHPSDFPTPSSPRRWAPQFSPKDRARDDHLHFRRSSGPSRENRGLEQQ
jgi:hypothetical protein